VTEVRWHQARRRSMTDYKRHRYGYGALEDLRRCRHAVFPSQGPRISAQCAFYRGYGEEGAFCRRHALLRSACGCACVPYCQCKCHKRDKMVTP